MWVPPSAACPLSLVSYCRFSGPVSRGRAPGPRPPHWLESSLFPPPLPHTHAPGDSLRNTCSLVQRRPARICFATKFVFLFSLSTVIFLLLSMLWITGFHCLCSWAFPCCSPRFQFEHRLFLFPLLGLVFAGCGAGVRLWWWKRFAMGGLFSACDGCMSLPQDHTNSTPPRASLAKK